jgi:hypothetical protein
LFKLAPELVPARGRQQQGAQTEDRSPSMDTIRTALDALFARQPSAPQKLVTSITPVRDIPLPICKKPTIRQTIPKIAGFFCL